MELLSETTIRPICDYLYPSELKPVSDVAKAPTSRNDREAAMIDALVSAGNSLRDAEKLRQSERREAPSAAGSTKQIAERQVSPKTSPMHREHGRGIGPTPPSMFSPMTATPMHTRSARRPGRRILKQSDLVAESGIASLRVLAAQAARDLTLVKSGSVKVADLPSIPVPETAVGGFGLDAAAGASSLYQAAALHNSAGKTHGNRATAPTSPPVVLSPLPQSHLRWKLLQNRVVMRSDLDTLAEVPENAILHTHDDHSVTGSTISPTNSQRTSNTNAMHRRNAAAAMNQLNTRVGGGADAIIPDLVSMQMEDEPFQFALKTFEHLRLGGIGVDLAAIPKIDPTLLEKMRKTATDALHQAQKSPRLRGARSVSPRSTARMPTTSGHADSHTSSARIHESGHADARFSSTLTMDMNPKTAERVFSLRFLPKHPSESDTTQSTSANIPPAHARGQPVTSLKIADSLPRIASVCSTGPQSTARRFSVQADDDSTDPRLYLFMKTPQPPPYLSYMSRVEMEAPVKWPTLSAARSEVLDNVHSKVPRNAFGGRISTSRTARPSHQEFLKFMATPVEERGCTSPVFEYPEEDMSSPQSEVISPRSHTTGSPKSRQKGSPFYDFPAETPATDSKPAPSNMKARRRVVAQHATGLLEHMDDLGVLAPKLSGQKFSESTPGKLRQLGAGDVYDLTKLAHDAKLLNKLRMMYRERGYTLNLKSAVVDNLLEHRATAQTDVPEDDIRFMRFYAETSRLQREHAAAQGALQWYSALVTEVARCQNDATTHPAQRFLLFRLQQELRDQRGVSKAFLEQMLTSLAIPDPLFSVNVPDKLSKRRGSMSIGNSSPFASMLSALSLVQAFIEKLKQRANKSTDPAVRRTSVDLDFGVVTMGHSHSRNSTLSTRLAPHMYSAMQLMHMLQSCPEPLVLHHPGVQVMLAFIRRIAGVSLFEWDEMHARLGLLPHTPPIEVIIQKSFYERVKLAKAAAKGGAASNGLLDAVWHIPENTTPYSGGVFSDMFNAATDETQPTTNLRHKHWRLMVQENNEDSIPALCSPLKEKSFRFGAESDGSSTPPLSTPNPSASARSLETVTPARMYSFVSDEESARIRAEAEAEAFAEMQSSARQRRVQQRTNKGDDDDVTATLLQNTPQRVQEWKRRLSDNLADVSLTDDGGTAVNIVPIIGITPAGGRRMSLGPFSHSIV